MNEQQPQVQVVDAPAERPPLAYGRSQLAALVIVQTGNVASIPPQVFASVTLASDPNSIVALVGPESDLGSVQDAVVFSQAYAMRNALRDVLAKMTCASDEAYAVRDAAQAVLDAATPQFLEAKGMKAATAEERLAEAREGYDPTQNPDTTGITSDTAMSIDATGDVGGIASDKPAVH